MLETVSETTAIYYLRLYNVAFNEAIREGIVRINPIALLPKEDKPKKQQAERAYLTIEEVKKLLNTSFEGNPHIKWAFLFACYTGLRYSDLKNLKVTDIEDGKIKYRQLKSKTEFHYLPIGEVANSILKQIDRPTIGNKVFHKLPSSNSYTNYQIKIWAAQAGVTKKVSWHVARHTYACLLIGNQVDIYTVSKLLGHSSVQVTQIYAKIMDEAKEKAVNQLPKLDFS